MRHADDVVDFLLTETMTPEIANLVTMLACPSEELMKAIVVSGKLKEKVTLLVSDDRTPDLAIARAAKLTLGLFCSCPVQAMEECAYILALLRFVHVDVVLQMFSEICGGKERFGEVRQWLVDCGFITMVVDELNEMDHEWKSPESTDHRLDRVFLKARSLYALLAKFSEAWFEGKFDKDLVLRALSREFVHAPPFVRNRYWKAVRKMCQKDTVEKMYDVFYPKCMKVLEEHSERLYEYHVEAIGFLNTLISSTSHDVLSSSVEFLVLNFLLRFQNSSILHRAVRKFIKVTLANERFRERILAMYVPVLITEARSTCNRVIRPTLYKAMAMCRNVIDESPEKYRKLVASIPGYKDFITCDLQSYREQLTQTYGGQCESIMYPVFPHGL